MSLQIEHKTEKGTVLFYLPPNGADRFKMFTDIARPYLSYFIGVETYRHYVPDGAILIGLTSEITEEQLSCVFDEVVAIESWDDYKDSPNIAKISRLEQLNFIIEELGIQHPSVVLFKPND